MALGGHSRQDDLLRISDALTSSLRLVRRMTRRPVAVEEKSPGDPVTAVDRAVDTLLKATLPNQFEGWLSEETLDDPARLDRDRVWVVDPIDGTREFVRGIPEWCVSIGLVENGRAVAGGVGNPSTGAVVLGSLETGVYWCGARVEPRACRSRQEAVVLASRNEFRNGLWDGCESDGFALQPMGSAAWKLAQIAGGRADATWTFNPRNEWDIAAGVALVHAAGGSVARAGGAVIEFNRPDPLLVGGFTAFAQGARDLFAPVIAAHAAALA
ncbi:MAG: myo-inositol-1(or 4)-monophosphatase [Myxococcota bacterium]|jgi:myo-inositol-1(or 4)-monophosphatase